MAPASIYMPPDPFQAEPHVPKVLAVLARRHPDAKHRLGTAARGLKWKGRHEAIVAACILRQPEVGVAAMAQTYRVADEHGGKALQYFRRVYEGLLADGERSEARDKPQEPDGLREAEAELARMRDAYPE